MRLLRRFLQSELPELVSNGIRLNAIGNLERLPDDIRRTVADGIERTRGNTALQLNLALSYGGRDDITRAVRVLAAEAAAGECLQRFGFTFLFAPHYHPAFKHIAPVRQALGVRTVFNILGPLVNPAAPPYHVIGAFSDEIAEVIAAHFRDAYEADPNGTDASASRAAARGWLERAGDRAGALGAPEDALRAFDDAAALAEEPSEQARLLERAGSLAFMADHMDASELRLREAVNLYTTSGDTHSAARSAASLGLALWQLKRSDEALAILLPAFGALSGEERDVDVGNLAAEIARIEFFQADLEQAREHIEVALDIAESHRDLPLISHALNTKSLILGYSRPHEQHALLRESLRVAEEADLVEPMLRAINNLIVLTEERDRPDEASELLERGLAIAKARGHRHYVTWFGAGFVVELVEDGQWDQAFTVADESQPEGVLTAANSILAALVLSKASFERDDDDASRAWLGRLQPGLVESSDQAALTSGLIAEAVAAFTDKKLATGLELLDRTWQVFRDTERWSVLMYVLWWAADGASLLADTAAAASFAELYDSTPPAGLTRTMRAHGGRVRAFRAIAAGDEDAAADAFQGIGALAHRRPV
jgi:tetratricopeptide (TPR) repeat protein